MRLSEAEKRTLVETAVRFGLTPSEYVRLKCCPPELADAFAQMAGVSQRAEKDFVAEPSASRFRCPVCDFSAGSAKARCPAHARLVVPA